MIDSLLLACGLWLGVETAQAPQRLLESTAEREGAADGAANGDATEAASLSPELALEGVVVTRDPANALALVRSAGSSRARAVRVGQSVSGLVLLEVTRDSVLFRGLEEPARRVYLRGAAPPEDVAVAEAPWDRRELRRAEAKMRLEREIPVILEETRLAPRVDNGEVRGLSLERLPDGTLLSESGLRPGDVLLSLNGEPLYSLSELWGLLARLADSEVDELRLLVDRGGAEVRLAYALTR